MLQRELEGRTPAWTIRLHPDAATVHLDDALDQGQADAGAFRAGVKLFEKAEKLVLMARVDAHAVVSHEEARLAVQVEPGN